MVNNEQQDGNADLPTAPAAIPPLSGAGAARRRIAGLGVSGVVMTLASSHAMAAIVCKSPSGALSGNLNSQRPDVTCEGRSPGYWKNHSWPAGIARTALFSSYFPCGAPLNQLSCYEILTTQLDPINMGMHIMATYLNVLSGKITFLDTETVFGMWNEWQATRSYTPTAGATPWTGEQLKAYLESTQTFDGD